MSNELCEPPWMSYECQTSQSECQMKFGHLLKYQTNIKWMSNESKITQIECQMNFWDLLECQMNIFIIYANSSVSVVSHKREKKKNKKQK